MPSYRKYHAMSHYAAPHRTAYHRIPPHNTAYHRYAATHTAAHHFTSPPTTSHHLPPPPTASPTSQYSSTLPSMADGVEIMSINIISAAPVDNQLTRSLASGAVASAEALQAETAARGKANAIRIAAEAEAAQAKIQAQGRSDSDVIRAKGEAEAQRIAAEGDKAAEVLRSEGQAAGIRSISGALNEKGGAQAMSQRIAESYVGQLAGMARESSMIIVPDKPNDVSGVLATAMGLGKAVSKVE